eukprot:SAG31_NODE_1088_length_9973_cov_3.175309_2_plen_41_part_00
MNATASAFGPLNYTLKEGSRTVVGDEEIVEALVEMAYRIT